jgi:hypothetical protein
VMPLLREVDRADTWLLALRQGLLRLWRAVQSALLLPEPLQPLLWL